MSISSLDSYTKDIASMEHFQPWAIMLADFMPHDWTENVNDHVVPNIFSRLLIKEPLKEKLIRISAIIVYPFIHLAVFFAKIGLTVSLEALFTLDIIIVIASKMSRFLFSKLSEMAYAIVTYVISFFKKDSQGDEKCLICWESMWKKDSIKRPNCTEVCQDTQTMHDKCLKTALKIKDKCPSCQKANPLGENRGGDNPWRDSGAGVARNLHNIPWRQLPNDVSMYDLFRMLKKNNIPFKNELVRPFNFRKYSITVLDQNKPLRIYFNELGKLIFPTPRYLFTNYMFPTTLLLEIRRDPVDAPLPAIPAPPALLPPPVAPVPAPVAVNPSCSRRLFIPLLISISTLALGILALREMENERIRHPH